MLIDLFVFAVSLCLVVKGATMANKYAARLARSFCLSKYIVGFVVVAVISILPETFVAINSAIKGIPSFGLGTLLGSNVADLTLVFSIILVVAGKGIKVQSRVLKNRWFYSLLLFLPLVLGLDGHFSRLEGAALILAGGIFYFAVLRDGREKTLPTACATDRLKDFAWLLLGMAVLLVGAYFTVESATALAASLKVNPILIGMLVVGLGTTLPELLFSLRCVKKNDDSLAVGDILGTVLADATIVVGILALMSPFLFPVKIIYITGSFMVVASFVLFYFMHSGRSLSKKEGYLLLIFWLIFVLVEFIANR